MNVTKNQMTLAQLGQEVPLERGYTLCAQRKYGEWEYCLAYEGMTIAVRHTNGGEEELTRLLARAVGRRLPAGGVMQPVYESETQSGIRGLFTNGTLAAYLPEDWDKLTHEQRVAFCKRYRFELVTTTA